MGIYQNDMVVCLNREDDIGIGQDGSLFSLTWDPPPLPTARVEGPIQDKKRKLHWENGRIACRSIANMHDLITDDGFLKLE